MSSSKMIQVRNVPASLHRKIESRARAAGMTMTDYIQRLLERDVSGQLTLREALEQIRTRSRVPVPGGAAAWIADGRDENDASVVPADDA